MDKFDEPLHGSKSRVGLQRDSWLPSDDVSSCGSSTTRTTNTSSTLTGDEASEPSMRIIDAEKPPSRRDIQLKIHVPSSSTATQTSTFERPYITEKASKSQQTNMSPRASTSQQANIAPSATTSQRLHNAYEYDNSKSSRQTDSKPATIIRNISLLSSTLRGTKQATIDYKVDVENQEIDAYFTYPSFETFKFVHVPIEARRRDMNESGSNAVNNPSPSMEPSSHVPFPEVEKESLDQRLDNALNNLKAAIHQPCLTLNEDQDLREILDKYSISELSDVDLNAPNQINSKCWLHNELAKRYQSKLFKPPTTQLPAVPEGSQSAISYAALLAKSGDSRVAEPNRSYAANLGRSNAAETGGSYSTAPCGSHSTEPAGSYAAEPDGSHVFESRRSHAVEPRRSYAAQPGGSHTAETYGSHSVEHAVEPRWSHAAQPGGSHSAQHVAEPRWSHAALPGGSHTAETYGSHSVEHAVEPRWSHAAQPGGSHSAQHAVEPRWSHAAQAGGSHTAETYGSHSAEHVIEPRRSYAAPPGGSHSAQHAVEPRWSHAAQAGGSHTAETYGSHSAEHVIEPRRSYAAPTGGSHSAQHAVEPRWSHAAQAGGSHTAETYGSHSAEHVIEPRRSYAAPPGGSHSAQHAVEPHWSHAAQPGGSHTTETYGSHSAEHAIEPRRSDSLQPVGSHSAQHGGLHPAKYAIEPRKSHAAQPGESHSVAPAASDSSKHGESYAPKPGGSNLALFDKSHSAVPGGSHAPCKLHSYLRDESHLAVSNKLHSAIPCKSHFTNPFNANPVVCDGSLIDRSIFAEPNRSSSNVIRGSFSALHGDSRAAVLEGIHSEVPSGSHSAVTDGTHSKATGGLTVPTASNIDTSGQIHSAVSDGPRFVALSESHLGALDVSDRSHTPPPYTLRLTFSTESVPSVAGSSHLSETDGSYKTHGITHDSQPYIGGDSNPSSELQEHSLQTDSLRRTLGSSLPRAGYDPQRSGIGRSQLHLDDGPQEIVGKNSQQLTEQFPRSDPQQIARSDPQQIARANLQKIAQRIACEEIEKIARADSQQITCEGLQPITRADSQRIERVDPQQIARADSQKIARADSQQIARTDSQQITRADLRESVRIDSQRIARADPQQIARADPQQIARTDSQRIANSRPQFYSSEISPLLGSKNTESHVNYGFQPQVNLVPARSASTQRVEPSELSESDKSHGNISGKTHILSGQCSSVTMTDKSQQVTTRGTSELTERKAYPRNRSPIPLVRPQPQDTNSANGANSQRPALKPPPLPPRRSKCPPSSERQVKPLLQPPAHKPPPLPHLISVKSPKTSYLSSTTTTTQSSRTYPLRAKRGKTDVRISTPVPTDDSEDDLRKKHKVRQAKKSFRSETLRKTVKIQCQLHEELIKAINNVSNTEKTFSTRPSERNARNMRAQTSDEDHTDTKSENQAKKTKSTNNFDDARDMARSDFANEASRSVRARNSNPNGAPFGPYHSTRIHRGSCPCTNHVNRPCVHFCAICMPPPCSPLCVHTIYMPPHCCFPGHCAYHNAPPHCTHAPPCACYAPDPMPGCETARAASLSNAPQSLTDDDSTDTGDDAQDTASPDMQSASEVRSDVPIDDADT